MNLVASLSARCAVCIHQATHASTDAIALSTARTIRICRTFPTTRIRTSQSSCAIFVGLALSHNTAIRFADTARRAVAILQTLCAFLSRGVARLATIAIFVGCTFLDALLLCDIAAISKRAVQGRRTHHEAAIVALRRAIRFVCAAVVLLAVQAAGGRTVGVGAVFGVALAVLPSRPLAATRRSRRRTAAPTWLAQTICKIATVTTRPTAAIEFTDVRDSVGTVCVVEAASAHVHTIVRRSGTSWRICIGATIAPLAERRAGVFPRERARTIAQADPIISTQPLVPLVDDEVVFLGIVEGDEVASVFTALCACLIPRERGVAEEVGAIGCFGESAA